MKKYFLVSYIQSYTTGGWAFAEMYFDVNGTFFKRSNFLERVKTDTPNVEKITIMGIVPLSEKQYNIFKQ